MNVMLIYMIQTDTDAEYEKYEHFPFTAQYSLSIHYIPHLNHLYLTIYPGFFW